MMSGKNIFIKMDKFYKKRDDCRGCGGKDLALVLDLGKMPPANAFLNKSELKIKEQKFPLMLYVCEDCRLLQLLHVVDPKIIFCDYPYLTSASSYLAEHFEAMADKLAGRFISSKNDLVIEIGGNDGVLLGRIKDRARVLNIDPAESITELSRNKGVETLTKFFSNETADEVLKKYGNAKVVVANNVMAHIDNIRGIFEGVKKLIAKDGVFVFEVHWAGNLIGDGGFDQIYHEHLCYYSLISLKRLAEIAGLQIFDVETVPMHGESLRVYMAKKRTASPAVEKMLLKEKRLGLDKTATFLKFRERVLENREKLNLMLANIKKENKIIAGYGAPAKGNTLLNYCGINGKTIDYLVDTTSFKQGTFAPGSKIPVLHPEELNARRPDYVLLLAWNYADAILNKETKMRSLGTKFILPVPEPKIL